MSPQEKKIGLAALIVLAIVIAYHYKHKKSADTMTGVRNVRSRFTSDIDNWPTSAQFGASADTYPYGNYANGVGMTYPWYNPP